IPILGGQPRRDRPRRRRPRGRRAAGHRGTGGGRVRRRTDVAAGHGGPAAGARACGDRGGVEDPAADAGQLRGRPGTDPPGRLVAPRTVPAALRAGFAAGPAPGRFGRAAHRATASRLRSAEPGPAEPAGPGEPAHPPAAFPHRGKVVAVACRRRVDPAVVVVTATTRGSTMTRFPPRDGLSAFEAPMRVEADIAGLEVVQGEVPEHLSGTYYRVVTDRQWPPAV